MNTNNSATQTVLGSPIDRRSFIVPCLAFTNSTHAALYEADRSYLNDRRPFSPSDVYASVNVGPHICIPRISDADRRFHADDLLTGKGQLEEVRWEKLRDKAAPSPFAGSFNTCLLVDGPRKFSLYHSLSSKLSKAWQRMHDGERDCFAVWGRSNGDPIGKHEVLDGSNHVAFANGGCGALYACTTRFTNDGEPDGFITRMIKLEFSVKYKDPTRDDMLSVRILRHLARTRADEGPYDWAKEEETEGWKVLVERAQQGFSQFCHPVPQETDSWRKFYVDQMKHLADDKLIRDGSSYRDQVRSTDCQQALGSICFPWQLQVVVEVHCGPGHFEDSPHRFGTASTRVRNMLAAHECQSERRYELQAMVDNFVAVNDALWNWSDD